MWWILGATLLGGCGGIGLEAEGSDSLFRVEPAEDLQFGPTPLGGDGAAIEVKITNLSPDPITLTSLEITGSADEVFFVERDPAPTRLLTAQQLAFDLVYQPDAMGNHVALLVITLDAGGVVEVERRLLGQGVEPTN